MTRNIGAQLESSWLDAFWRENCIDMHCCFSDEQIWAQCCGHDSTLSQWDRVESMVALEGRGYIVVRGTLPAIDAPMPPRRWRVIQGSRR